MSKTRLTLTKRGENVVAALGVVGFAGIIMLANFLEIAL